MNELLASVKGSSQELKPELQSRWATCSRHGFEYVECWLPSLELWTAATGCPACAREKATGQRQPRAGQTMQELRLELAGIPERFRNKILKDITGKEFKEALEIARSFTPSDNLLIVGRLASGKTSFACALLSQCVEFGSVEYHSALSAMESLWAASRPAGWEDGAYGLAETLSSFSEPALLVLDDIQDIRTAEELSWMQRVLGARHREKRGTILVGAPDLEGLESVLGSRLLDQLRGWKLLTLGKES